MRRLADDNYVTCLCKGAERYILLFDKASCPDALRTLGRWAANSELSLTWYDVAVLSKRIREVASK